MRPYGQRLGAYDYDNKDEPVSVVVKDRARQAGKRECLEALFRTHSETCPCRWPEDTEATMRRVMDKWLRGV